MLNFFFFFRKSTKEIDSIYKIIKKKDGINLKLKGFSYQNR